MGYFAGLGAWQFEEAAASASAAALDISMLNKIKISTDYFIHFWLSIKFL